MKENILEYIEKRRELIIDEENILCNIQKKKEELIIDEENILCNVQKKKEEFDKLEKENRVNFVIVKRDAFCSRCNNKITKIDYNRLAFIYEKSIDNIPDNDIFCLECLNSPFWRTGTLDKNCSTGIGYVTEVLVAKFLGIKTCFDIEGKFNHLAFDIYEDEDFGRINVKGSTFRGNGCSFAIRKNKIADFFFCIGYDRDRKHVKVVYIIPNEDYISEMASLYISIDDFTYEWFRQDEKPWDELFHTMKLEDCPVILV